MRIIGLTGGIGSGKSTVGRRLVMRGIPVIDADAVGHEVLAPGGAAEAAVKSAFPGAVHAQGGIDREALGRIVFEDPAARNRLNALTHPVIAAEVGRRCAGLAGAGHPIAVVEAALLGEGGERDPWLDGLILVNSTESTRIRRLVELRDMAESDARSRIQAQTDPCRKIALADYVIDNEGSLDGLHAQVDVLVEVLHAETGRLKH